MTPKWGIHGCILQFCKFWQSLSSLSICCIQLIKTSISGGQLGSIWPNLGVKLGPEMLTVAETYVWNQLVKREKARIVMTWACRGLSSGLGEEIPPGVARLWDNPQFHRPASTTMIFLEIICWGHNWFVKVLKYSAEVFMTGTCIGDVPRNETLGRPIDCETPYARKDSPKIGWLCEGCFGFWTFLCLSSLL